MSATTGSPKLFVRDQTPQSRVAPTRLRRSLKKGNQPPLVRSHRMTGAPDCVGGLLSSCARITLAARFRTAPESRCRQRASVESLSFQCGSVFRVCDSDLPGLQSPAKPVDHERPVHRECRHDRCRDLGDPDRAQSLRLGPGSDRPQPHGLQLRHPADPVSLLGLGQPLADGIKLLFKEDYTPPGTERRLFLAAPVLIVISAVLAWAVVPWGGYLDWGG